MDKPEKVDPELCHIKTYRKCTEYITQYLNIEEIMGSLLSENVIRLGTYQEISRKRESGGPIAAAKLYLTETLMMDPNPESFHKFIRVLRGARQDYLANVLQSEYEAIRQSAQMQVKTKETKPQSKARKQPSQVQTDKSTASADISNIPETDSSRTPVMQETGEQTESVPSREALAIAAGTTNIKPVEPVQRDETLENKNEAKEMSITGSFAGNTDRQQQPITEPDSELDQAQLSLLQSTIPSPTSENQKPDSTPELDPDKHPAAKFRLDESELKIDRNKALGGGRFGNVYQCCYLGTDYAVKELTQLKYRKDVEKNLRQNKEILACAEIRHPSIVQFIGHSVGKINRQPVLLLVFELVDGQNLDTILHGDDQSMCNEYQLNDGKKYSIAKQICQAVAYIHHKKILHRDVKPANILVTKENKAKLCDLGLCKIKGANTLVSTMGKPQGTPLYMAYELVLDEGKASEASDVYSFGATMYDLFSEKFMWDIEDEDDAGGLEKLKNKMRRGEMPQELQNPGDTQPWKMIAECVHRDFTKRPVISRVLDTLDTLSQAL